MKPSGEIFLLIKSMTGKEKLFFRKKYLTLIEDADKNYLKLFDEISKQTLKGDEYDENEIKAGKYTGKFIKNFSFHKNFLYNSILNALLIFNRDNKDIFAIRNLTTQAEILADRLLNEQSLKLLQKVKKASQQKDLFNNLYEIINTERLIKKYSTNVEEYILNSKELFDEQYKVLELNKNLLDYYTLNENVGIFLRNQGSGRIREKDKHLEFEKIFESPLLKNFENAKSFLAKYIFYNLKIQYYLTNENFEEAYNYAKSAVELCENNFEKLKGKLDNYIFALNNLLNCQSRSYRYNESEITAAKLKSIAGDYPEMITELNKVFIFYSLSVLLLSKNIAVIDIKKLRLLETEIMDELTLYEHKITIYQRIILYFFLSVSNFIQNNFEKCIYWNSKIFNIGKTDLSEDYQCYARIIQLISYYELGYFDSMDYALKSAYHFISKKKKVYKYEIIIQKFLRRSFSIKTDKELIKMFGEMKDELEEIYKDDFEKNAFDAFNILYWLDSKINGKSVLEILKEKLN